MPEGDSDDPTPPTQDPTVLPPVVIETVDDAMGTGEVDHEVPVGPDGLPLWYHLQDAELLGMLLRRGAEAVSAKGWIASKHLPVNQEAISQYLDREYVNHEGKPVALEIPLDRRSRR